MKKVTRFLCTALACALIALPMSGCGGGGGEKNPSGDKDGLSGELTIGTLPKWVEDVTAYVENFNKIYPNVQVEVVGFEGKGNDYLTAQAAISDIINNSQPAPYTVEKIIEEVARTFGATSADIRSAKRSANISNARQVAMYIAREITQMPMEAIGKEFGGRDHSTVVYATQQVEIKLAKDSKMKSTVEDIIKNIRNN